MAGLKTFDELEFTDDYLFCKILTKNLDLCKELLELILDIKIKEVKIPEAQKALKHAYDSKGVRFDVYTEDTNDSVYEIEMQMYVEKDLPKRMRYYQGMIDLNLLEKGADYSKLKNSYVIFICNYDPFGKNLPVYSFKYFCEQDKSLELQDDTIKVVVNSKGNREGLSKKMKDFLDYLEVNVAEGEFSKRLDLATNQAKFEEKWRSEYMTLYEKLQREHNEGREEGLAEGILKEKTDIARNMLSDDSFTNEQISKVTGLDFEQIEELRRCTRLV